MLIISISSQEEPMSSPSISIKDYEYIDRLVKEGRKTEVKNWIVAHEAIEQTILLEYYRKVS